MIAFPQFRGLRRQRLKPSGYQKDKPTKGAGIGFALAILIYGLIAAVPIRAQDESSILYPGTYQAEDAFGRLPDDAKIVAVAGAGGGKAIETKGVTITARGTEVKLRWKTQGRLIIQVNDETIMFDPAWEKFPEPDYFLRPSHVLKRDLDAITASFYLQLGALVEPDVAQDNGWYEATIARSTLAETNTFQIFSMTPDTKSKGIFQLDTISVSDRSFENGFPTLAAIGITLGMTLFVVISALRERWRR